MLQRAEMFARRVLAGEDVDRETRIDRAFQLAYGTQATPSQTAAALEFLSSQTERIEQESEVKRSEVATVQGQTPASMQAWFDLCHVLLNSNQFLHID